MKYRLTKKIHDEYIHIFRVRITGGEFLNVNYNDLHYYNFDSKGWATMIKWRQCASTHTQATIARLKK